MLAESELKMIHQLQINNLLKINYDLINELMRDKNKDSLFALLN